MHRVLRRIVPAVPAIIAAAFVLTASAPANAASSLLQPKGYAVVVAPATVNGGTTAGMTATFTNEGFVRIESAALIWPAPLQVQSASLPAGMAQPTVSTCRHGGATVPCVQLHDLDLAPGASVTVSMSVSSPPACSNAAGAWTVMARPDTLISFLSALFGVNLLPLDAAHSSLTTTVVDSCHLQFAPPPAGAVVGQTITGSAYDQTGPSPAVDVLDQGGALVTSSSASISLALTSNPGSATLAGTTTASVVGGIATFGGLSLNEPGNGYTLTAASAGITPVTSAPFDVQAVDTACSGVTCTLSTGTTQGSAQVAASVPSGGGTSGTLVESVNAAGDGSLTCGSYQSADPNTYEFFTTDDSLGKVVTLDITDPQGDLPPYEAGDTNGFTIPGGDGDNDYDDVLWGQQICFQAPYEFTIRGGGEAPASTLPDRTTVYSGLLPDCSALLTGPCHDRSADSAPRDPSSPTGYDIVLVADIPPAAGDPRMN
jgi:hypothetical protein